MQTSFPITETNVVLNRAEAIKAQRNALCLTYGNLAAANRRHNAMFTIAIGVIMALMAVRGSANLYAIKAEGWEDWLAVAWPDVLAVVASVLERISDGMDFRGKRDAFTVAATACDEAASCAQMVLDSGGAPTTATTLSMLTAIESAADVHCPILAHKKKE